MIPPLISVALPVYNGADFLSQALDTILAQTYSDFELIVSDNQSTDETPAILAEYARRDKRVRVFSSDQFLPQATNVNRAVQFCSGEWVKLFCHDDLMHPHCLATLYDILCQEKQNHDLGLIGHADEWLFVNGYRHYTNSPENVTRSWKGRTYLKSWLEGRDYTFIGLPALTTAFVRKEAWYKSGMFDARFAHFDTFLWIQLLVNWDYLYHPPILTINRIHPGQVAVSARKTLRSFTDHRIFWPEFINTYADTLQLSPMTRAKLYLKPLTIAGSAIAIEVLKKRPRQVARIIKQLPFRVWPLLPIFFMRSWRLEAKKVAVLQTKVPISMIYPD